MVYCIRFPLNVSELPPERQLIRHATQHVNIKVRDDEYIRLSKAETNVLTQRPVGKLSKIKTLRLDKLNAADACARKDVRFLGHPLSNLFIILNVMSHLTQNLIESIKTGSMKSYTLITHVALSLQIKTCANVAHLC